jgi:hypothetical protein
MSTSGVLCRHSSVRTAHGAADDVMSDPMNDEEISHSIGGENLSTFRLRLNC